MAERLIEFYTSWPTEKISETLAELSAGRTWVTATPDRQNHVRLLADASETEKLVDDIGLRFASDGTFRLFLLPVEASLPRPKKPEPEEARPEEKEAPPPQRVSREELYADLTEGLGVTWQFVVMVGLAAIVAAIGLYRDSATVIIAAMVIAPLLKPNLALALGTTLGDLDLIGTSIRVNLIGMALGLVLAALVGVLLPIDPTTPEIALRTWVGLGDILLALASGVAAALSVTTAASSALIGVMVAVALMPPLVVVGRAPPGEHRLCQPRWRGDLLAPEGRAGALLGSSKGQDRHAQGHRGVGRSPDCPPRLGHPEDRPALEQTVGRPWKCPLQVTRFNTHDLTPLS
jgi:uncharacterized hydrophobic protein (TIGR00341 family)